MIEINLLPGKKRKAAAGGAGFKLALPDFRGLLASIKNRGCWRRARPR